MRSVAPFAAQFAARDVVRPRDSLWKEETPLCVCTGRRLLSFHFALHTTVHEETSQFKLVSFRERGDAASSNDHLMRFAQSVGGTGVHEMVSCLKDVDLIGRLVIG